MRGTAELLRRLPSPILTIGNFDGVHLGHQAILQTVIERARLIGGASVLYTFEPHPRKVLQPDRPPSLLATPEQKIELVEKAGIDVLIVESFDREFAKTEPGEFVREYVYQRIQPAEVYVGYDFHFGRDREGSMRLLTETGPKLGFSVTIIPEVTLGGDDVNSTRIRSLLRNGEVEEAASLLGRSYGVRGDVVDGLRRGREIGFPTANLAPQNEILPGPGVYVCEMEFLDDVAGLRSGERRVAVSNVGYRPTFDDGRDLVAEAHVLDFSGDLYGCRVELRFLGLLRRERRFESVDALKEQIGRDVEAGRRWFSENGQRSVTDSGDPEST